MSGSCGESNWLGRWPAGHLLGSVVRRTYGFFVSNPPGKRLWPSSPLGSSATIVESAFPTVPSPEPRSLDWLYDKPCSILVQVKPSLDSAESSGGDAAVLRTAGLRVTGPRLAVLRALRRRPHAKAETVRTMVVEELGAVSPQAIYNVLAALVDAGIARCIEPAGSVALYELQVGDNHHHVVCRGCGITADVDCAVGRRPCLTPSDTHGFVLDEAEVTFWGLCPACQSHREVDSRASTRSAGRVGQNRIPRDRSLPSTPATQHEDRPASRRRAE